VERLFGVVLVWPIMPLFVTTCLEKEEAVTCKDVGGYVWVRAGAGILFGVILVWPIMPLFVTTCLEQEEAIACKDVGGYVWVRAVVRRGGGIRLKVRLNPNNSLELF